MNDCKALACPSTDEFLIIFGNLVEGSRHVLSPISASSPLRLKGRALVYLSPNSRVRACVRFTWINSERHKNVEDHHFPF